MVNIKDVAKRAGVSPATVSRVLNDNYIVSQKRKEMVMSAINELGYEPNMAGRMLRASETKTLLVAFSVMIPEFLNGVTDAVRKANYDVLFSFTPTFAGSQNPLKPVHQGMVDGVILQDVMLKEEVLKGLFDKYPTVMCGGLMPFSLYQDSVIDINNLEISYEMTKHLIRKGKKRIASVGIVLDESIEPEFSRKREQGIKKALKEAGMIYDAAMNYKGDVGYDTGRSAVAYFMNLNEMPDAIFCFNDKIAIGCISALKNHGFKVPDDIYVTGFDNLGITDQFDPAITTIAQPFYDMGMESVRLLIGKIKGEAHLKPHKIEAKLVLRESTDDK